MYVFLNERLGIGIEVRKRLKRMRFLLDRMLFCKSKWKLRRCNQEEKEMKKLDMRN